MVVWRIVMLKEMAHHPRIKDCINSLEIVDGAVVDNMWTATLSHESESFNISIFDPLTEAVLEYRGSFHSFYLQVTLQSSTQDDSVVDRREFNARKEMTEPTLVNEEDEAEVHMLAEIQQWKNWAIERQELNSGFWPNYFQTEELVRKWKRREPNMELIKDDVEKTIPAFTKPNDLKKIQCGWCRFIHRNAEVCPAEDKENFGKFEKLVNELTIQANRDKFVSKLFENSKSSHLYLTRRQMREQIE